MKDGRQLKGVVVDDGGTKITVKTERLDLTIERERVERVVFDSAPDHFTSRGEDLLRQGDIPAARAAFRQALEIDPEDARAENGLRRIDQLTPEQLRALDVGKRRILAGALLLEAKQLLDRSLRDEALATLERAAQADRQNVEVIALGAQTALELWGEFRVPLAVYEEFFAQLKHIDPEHSKIADLELKMALLAPKRESRLEAERQKLLGEILSAADQGKYTRELLYKVDSLLEMEPGDSVKPLLLEVQAAVGRAGIQRGKFALQSGAAEVAAAP